MKTLDRYVVRNFLFSVVLWLAVLMSIRIVADLFVNMDEFTKSRRDAPPRTFGVVVRDIGTYYGFQSLAYFRDLGGVIIVASACFALARMNHTNELTAVLASGVSLHRVLLPVVLCAVGLNLLVVLDSELLIPRFKYRLVRSRDDVAGTDAFQVRTLTDAKGSNLSARRFHPARAGRPDLLEQPLVVLRDRRYAYIGHIAAPQAVYDRRAHAWRFCSEAAGRPGRPPRQAVLHLVGVEVQPTVEFIPTALGPAEILRRQLARPENRGKDPASVTGIRRVHEPLRPAPGLRIVAARLVLPHPGPDPRQGILQDARFEYRDQDRTLLGTFACREARFRDDPRRPGWELEGGVLLYHTDLDPSVLALRQARGWLRYMSTAEITRLLRLRRVPDREQALLARHSRFADLIDNLIMLIVAVPFILSRERNIKSSALLAVLMAGGLYVFIYLARYVGLPPLPAAALPILVFGPVAAVMLYEIKT